MNTSALVVFSGGQDSTTCLFWAKQKFAQVEALAFNYGQRHLTELEAAREIAEKANTPFKIMELPLLNALTSNSLTRPDIEIDREAGASAPNTLVEGRNMLFLTYAAIYAKSKGIKNIITGVSQTDFSGYPDCRDNFIRSINLTLNLAMDYSFTIHTPLMFITKCETWQLADKLGAFDIVRNHTVTCYNGIPGSGCGECPSCQLRQKGLDEYYKLKSSI